MAKISKSIQLIIASMSAILAISAVFLAARWLLRFLFRGANATVAAAIVAVAVLLQRQYEKRQQNATASRDKKVNLYETFLRCWFHVFGVGEIRTPVSRGSDHFSCDNHWAVSRGERNTG
jgi:hypothetical protein